MIALACLLEAPRAELFPLKAIQQEPNCISPNGFSLLAQGDGQAANLYLVCPAEEITPDDVNFFAIHGRGLICLAISAEQARRLRVLPMVANPTNPRCASFGRSIEAETGVSTGISAADRAHTMRVAANPTARPSELVSPGHVFPIIVQEGDTSAAAAALKVFGRGQKGSAVALCQVLREGGNAATLADLAKLAWARAMPVHYCDTGGQ